LHRLIRWYKESPPRLRVVFRAGAGGVRNARAEAEWAGGHGHQGAPRSPLANPPAVSPLAASPPLPYLADADSPGALPDAELPAPLADAPPARRALLVCFGNTCRSPVAAAMLQARLGDRWEVISAGTNAAAGQPVVEMTRVAAAERGIDLSGHRSRPLTVEDVRDAAIVVAMSERQARKILELQARPGLRVRLLGAFHPEPNTWGLPADPRQSAAGDDEVPDPIGEDLEFHRESCRRISEAVERLADWIEKREAALGQHFSGAGPADDSEATPAW
jgi:protein-tyrosine phosphatase